MFKKKPTKKRHRVRMGPITEWEVRSQLFMAICRYRTFYAHREPNPTDLFANTQERSAVTSLMLELVKHLAQWCDLGTGPVRPLLRWYAEQALKDELELERGERPN